MIRIITARDEQGIPTEWADYADREVGEVPASLALRFDAELCALKIAGLDLGVKRWTEAAFRIRRFRARATAKVMEVLGPDSEVPEAEQGEAIEEWVATQPDYLLAQQVAAWAAINLGGGRMTLLDVLSIPERDVEDIEEDPPYLDDEPEADDEGKA